MLFVDLDDFKTINDTRGHADGDRLLHEVARRLSASPALGRHGGAARRRRVRRPARAASPARRRCTTAAQRILDALAQPIELDERAGHGLGQRRHGALHAAATAAPTSSCARPTSRCTRPSAAASAARELYEAAPRGPRRRARLRGQWFARDDEQRAEIEAVLADPDGHRRSSSSRSWTCAPAAIAGYESLSRFNREPRRAPGRVVRAGAPLRARLRARGEGDRAALATPGRPAGHLPDLQRLSPSSLLSEEVRAVLPERLDGLVIEITENELVVRRRRRSSTRSPTCARAARGWPSTTPAPATPGLTHVMRLQPDIIKLDRALTTGVDPDPAKAPLISSFVRYARDIDADVCAEGVETLGRARAARRPRRRLRPGLRHRAPGRPVGRRSPPRPRRRACTPSRRRWRTAATGSRRSPAGSRQSRRRASSRRCSARWPPSSAPTRSACLDADAAPPQATRCAALREGFAHVTLPIPHGDRIVGHLEVYCARAAPVEPLRARAGAARRLSARPDPRRRGQLGGVIDSELGSPARSRATCSVRFVSDGRSVPDWQARRARRPRRARSPPRARASPRAARAARSRARRRRRRPRRRASRARRRTTTGPPTRGATSLRPAIGTVPRAHSGSSGGSPERSRT